MKKLQKGQRVVITCTSPREMNEPKVAFVETSGKKWVTVRFENTGTFPYYFDVANSRPEADYLSGGCKDGSFQIFRLYDVPSIEEYNYQLELKNKKSDVFRNIVDYIQKNINDISIEKLLYIKSTICEEKC